MRQRVALAIALLHRPAVIVADEPTTALDVSIQAQILAEMKDLVRDSGTALIWISHDLATVSSLAGKLAVMYAGRMVETGPTGTVLSAPRHHYTRGLLDSCPPRPSRGRICGRSRAPRPRCSACRRAALSRAAPPAPPPAPRSRPRSPGKAGAASVAIIRSWRPWHDAAGFS
ncbi:hypothetical protein ACFQU7_00070 [Pseudoroseomonas wenyumeiae]